MKATQTGPVSFSMFQANEAPEEYHGTLGSLIRETRKLDRQLGAYIDEKLQTAANELRGAVAKLGIDTFLERVQKIGKTDIAAMQKITNSEAKTQFSEKYATLKKWMPAWNMVHEDDITEAADDGSQLPDNVQEVLDADKLALKTHAQLLILTGASDPSGAVNRGPIWRKALSVLGNPTEEQLPSNVAQIFRLTNALVEKEAKDKKGGKGGGKGGGKVAPPMEPIMDTDGAADAVAVAAAKPKAKGRGKAVKKKATAKAQS